MEDASAIAAQRAADLAEITKACEEAYADASREGYADHPTVIAAVAALKSAHAELVAIDSDLNSVAAGVGFSGFRGFFRGVGAVRRADRAASAAEAAYLNLRAAILRAGEDNLRKMGFDDDWISAVRTLGQMQNGSY